jgi:hypothetical protein
VKHGVVALESGRDLLAFKASRIVPP